MKAENWIARGVQSVIVPIISNAVKSSLVHGSPWVLTDVHSGHVQNVGGKLI